MHILPLSEFRANASAMLDLVEQGETVRIMRHGRPVADLVPVRADQPVPKASYQEPFDPVIELPHGYSAVQGLLDERQKMPW